MHIILISHTHTSHSLTVKSIAETTFIFSICMYEIDSSYYLIREMNTPLYKKKNIKPIHDACTKLIFCKLCI